MKTSRVIYAVLAVQCAVMAFLVFAPAQPTAMAQVPDQGAQLHELIEQSKSLNAKMDRLLTLLESGKIQVRVAESK